MLPFWETPRHFNSRPTNSISYESWQSQIKLDTLLRLLKLKLQPREIAKVARVQVKKNHEDSEIYNFWAPQTLYVHLKRKLGTIVILIYNKIEGLCNEPTEIAHRRTYFVWRFYWSNLDSFFSMFARQARAKCGRGPTAIIVSKCQAK